MRFAEPCRTCFDLLDVFVFEKATRIVVIRGMKLLRFLKKNHAPGITPTIRSFTWMNHGLNPNETQHADDGLGLQQEQHSMVLPNWESAYTFSKSGLTDERTRKKLLEAKIIFEHQSSQAGAPVSLFIVVACSEG